MAKPHTNPLPYALAYRNPQEHPHAVANPDAHPNIPTPHPGHTVNANAHAYSLAHCYTANTDPHPHPLAHLDARRARHSCTYTLTQPARAVDLTMDPLVRARIQVETILGFRLPP